MGYPAIKDTAKLAKVSPISDKAQTVDFPIMKQFTLLALTLAVVLVAFKDVEGE